MVLFSELCSNWQCALLLCLYNSIHICLARSVIFFLCAWSYFNVLHILLFESCTRPMHVFMAVWEVTFALQAFFMVHFPDMGYSCLFLQWHLISVMLGSLLMILLLKAEIMADIRFIHLQLTFRVFLLPGHILCSSWSSEKRLSINCWNTAYIQNILSVPCLKILGTSICKWHVKYMH